MYPPVIRMEPRKLSPGQEIFVALVASNIVGETIKTVYEDQTSNQVSKDQHRPAK